MRSYQSRLFANLLFGDDWSAGTYQATNRITIPGDMRTTYTAGTQVQALIQDASGMQYGYVTAATFASNVTTVTLSETIFVSGKAISVRPSPFGADNIALGRTIKELSIFGANGLTITNAAPKFNLFVEGVGAGKVNTFMWGADADGISLKLGRDNTNVDALRIDATPTGVSRVSLFSNLTFSSTLTSGFANLTDLITMGQYSLAYAASGSSTGSNRLALAGPNGGEFTIGPTDNAAIFRRIRLRAIDVMVENVVGGTAQAGYVWHSLNLDPNTKSTKGENGTWADAPYTVLANLNSPVSHYNQWQPAGTNSPVAGSWGVVQTYNTAGGNNFTPVNGYALIQAAYVNSGASPALYLRQNNNAAGWGSWIKLYTQADFSLGDYVRIAGGDTIQSPITVRQAIIVGTTADATSQIGFNTSSSPNGNAASIVVTGGSATIGRGVFNVNAASMSVPSLNISGTLAVSGSASMAGPLTITTGSIVMGRSTFGEARIATNFDDWYLYSSAAGFGLYSINQGIAAFNIDKASRQFNFTAGGTIGGTLTINGALNVASASGILTSGSVTAANGNFSNDVFAPGAFRGARLHIYSSCIAYGQGFLPSWNDYGDGATVLTNARGGGTGGFKFRQMNSDGGGQIFLAFINPNGTIGSASDERMKDFGAVLDVQDALRFIREQRVQHITWKHSGDKDIAFGAQSIAKTTPFLAHYDKGADFWQLYYPKVALYHHEALNHILTVQGNHEADIQILIRKNESLEEQLDSLREQLDSLR